MAALDTGASSMREFNSSGRAVGISECINKKKVEVQSKIFYLSAKKNNLGYFITVSEQETTEKPRYQVPGEPATRYKKCLFLLQMPAIQCRDFLKKFWEISSRSDDFKTIEKESTIKEFDDGRRSYHLELKQNDRGRYLQVSCKDENDDSCIAIPVTGLLKVHDVLADLIKTTWTPTESPESVSIVKDNVLLKDDTDDTPCIEVDCNKEGQRNMSTKSAAKRKSLPQATEQAEPSGTLYVAVQLRMSMRRTHLEVQVLVDNNKQTLKNWQQAWKRNVSRIRHGMNKENSDEVDNKEKKEDTPDIKIKSARQYAKRKKSDKPSMKNEELHQPNMPEPEPVLLHDFGVNQPVAARLTSSASGTARFIHYGCSESTPCKQPRGYASRKPHTWVFQLSDKPRFDARQFHLHLHNETSESTNGDKTWGVEICKAFSFQDLQGSCFLSQLGFTQDNQPAQRTPGSGDFGRIEKPGEVMKVQALKSTIKYHQCVINYSQSVGLINGPMQGTGFCVGNNQRKYVLTCRHIFSRHEEEFMSGKFSISFSNYGSGETSFVLRSVAAQDELLDYIILDLDEPGKAPQPIPCCSIEGTINLHLTIIGYRSPGDLAFDSKVELQLIDENSVNQVKHLVSQQWPQFPSNDYDAITSLSRYLILYNVASHKQGSSGSPVLQFMPDESFKLVAVHRCGFPDFYYGNDNTKALAQKMMSENYAVEAGTRLSSIYAHLRENDIPVLREIFDIAS